MMRLKLTDKIRKFFGQAEQVDLDDGLDGDVPAYGGSLQVSVANLAASKPSAARRETATHPSVPQQLQLRPPCPPGGQDQAHIGGGGGAAAAVDKGYLQQQQQHGQHTPHGPSCTNSQKDTKDFSGGLRTTGQDESYTLQNEVYFPQLLLTLQGGTPEQKAVAAEALFNFTAESDAARQRATQAGVVAHLVDLLRSGTEHGKMYAAYTLSSLTTIDESLEQMHHHGAIPALIDILSTCPLLVCKKGAMRALGRLARSDEAAQEIVSAGGLGPIIALLSRPDSSLVRRCLIALYFIGADKDALQQAIGAAGALPQLLLLVRSESPDVQAEATDVLKVLCRNGACGRMLAELNGIDVLVATAHSGLTSRAKAAATRALQRLQDIPDLKDALAGSTAASMPPLDPSMSPSHSSQLNSSSAAPAAAAMITAAAAAAAAAAATAAGPQLSPTMQAASAVPPAALAVQRSPVHSAHASSALPAVSAGGPAAAMAGPPLPAVCFAGGSEPEDLKQLAQVLATGNSRWLREKAAAAVEQLATDNLVACRDLAGLGVLSALMDMLDAANSSSTRRAAARALGQLSDDAVLLVHMADAAVVANLLLAAPQLAGSAQRGVMRVLHSLASVPNAVSSCFKRQQAVHSMMQILEGGAPGSPTATGPLASGGSSGGSSGSGPDAGVSSRALEVLLALCRVDEAALQDIKDYPGGFKSLVSQLQHGPRSASGLILQLLAVLAQHKQHQEDLLKCGVVPTLLLLYRSADSAVALQAARIMESLSEPASSILQRSLSAGHCRMGDSSSSSSSGISSGSSSCSNTPTASAAAQQQQQPSPLGAEARAAEQQPSRATFSSPQAPASSSADGSTDCSPGGGSGGSDSAIGAPVQQPQEAAAMSPLRLQQKAGSRPSAAKQPSPRQPGGPGLEPSSLGRHSSTMPISNSSHAAQGANPPSPQQDAAATTAPAATAAAAGTCSQVASTSSFAVQPSAGDKAAATSSSTSSSPPRRVAVVAAALEAAALACVGADASGPLPPSPTAARGRQSSIPVLHRGGSKTPTGLGQAPLVARRPSSSKPEQPNEPQQQQQQQPLQHQEHREQPSPSTVAQQQPAQEETLLPEPKQQRVSQQQQQMPSRLPRRLPQAPGSSSGPSTSSPGAEPGGRSSTPDPASRKQQAPGSSSSPGAKPVLPGSPTAAAAAASGRSPGTSAVHLRVLAAQKQSQKHMSGAAEASSEAAAAGPSGSGGQQQQQQQQSFDSAGTGRVMQMAAAIAASAEAAARSSSPQRPSKQLSQPQAQLQQQAQQHEQQQQQQQRQQQQQQQSHEEVEIALPPPPAAAAAAAAAAAKAGAADGAAQQAAAEPAGSSKAAGEAGTGAREAAAPTATPAAAAAAAAPANSSSPAGSSPGPRPAGPPAAASPLQDKARGSSAALPGQPAAAEADDLLSSTYDNLHGLLLKKGDIEICRTAEGRKCRLGEGGFGVVYKAVMNGVDEVAVKLVKAETPSRKELELFLKEVQTLAKLHHRNIVQFYGACLEMGSMFFVTELMKGGDLYSALRHHSETMKWERLGRKVALDVALGLNYLHAQRPPMMHRDLKSPNVLLSEEGVAKIADVGMVRSQVKDLVTAQPVMTPLWAAPEVVRHERASIKADIWSYGILIWELITGEDITEYQPLSISRQVGPSPNAKAMALPARCPAVARKLFVACTQMDPERRPGAQQLVEWLRADIAASRG